MLSLDEEVRLYSTNAEREKYETQATLFGIIVALEYLEKAYVRDSVTARELVADYHLLTPAFAHSELDTPLHALGYCLSIKQ